MKSTTQLSSDYHQQILVDRLRQARPFVDDMLRQYRKIQKSGYEQRLYEQNVRCENALLLNAIQSAAPCVNTHSGLAQVAASMQANRSKVSRIRYDKLASENRLYQQRVQNARASSKKHGQPLRSTAGSLPRKPPALLQNAQYESYIKARERYLCAKSSCTPGDGYAPKKPQTEDVEMQTSAHSSRKSSAREI